MLRVIIVMAAVAMVGAAACGSNAGVTGTAAPEATVAAAVVSAPTAVTAPTVAAAPRMRDCAGEMDVECVVDVVIGPELEDCVGVAPMRCMVVDGGLFYDEIEGFEHEAGYRYRIRMERYDPWGGEPPPADASAYGYRLVEVVERVRAR